MGKSDKLSERYDKQQKRKKADSEIISSDAPPIADAPIQQAHSSRSVGRNDPCPCGSGKKYKKCCGAA